MDNTNRLPKHVSIIMDGNGRWAKARGLDRVKGHIEGVESVRACIEAAVEKGIEYLSVYAFSEENWNRPQEEVVALMELMMQSMKNEFRTFMDNHVRFMVLGNRSRLSDNLNRTIDEMMEATSAEYKTTLKTAFKKPNENSIIKILAIKIPIIAAKKAFFRSIFKTAAIIQTHFHVHVLQEHSLYILSSL